MNFEEISKKVRKLGKDTVEEVQRMNEVRQLNGKVSDAKKQINKLYMEIGKKLYEQYREAPFEGFESEIRSINEKNDQIEQLREQIRVVKGVVLCPCCNMEVPENERFCSNCGNKMPEVVRPEEDDEDAVVVDSVDVTEEAAEDDADTEYDAAEAAADGGAAETEAEENCAAGEAVNGAADDGAAETEAAENCTAGEVVNDAAEDAEAVDEASEEAEEAVEHAAEEIEEIAKEAATGSGEPEQESPAAQNVEEDGAPEEEKITE